MCVCGGGGAGWGQYLQIICYQNTGNFILKVLTGLDFLLG